jgi:hypothetical protein
MNESVEIDQDYGVPGKSKYTFDKLKVGGALKTTDLEMYQQLRSAATRHGKKLKRKFSVRKIVEADETTGKPVQKIAVIRTK